MSELQQKNPGFPENLKNGQNPRFNASLIDPETKDQQDKRFKSPDELLKELLDKKNGSKIEIVHNQTETSVHINRDVNMPILSPEINKKPLPQEPEPSLTMDQIKNNIIEQTPIELLPATFDQNEFATLTTNATTKETTTEIDTTPKINQSSPSESPIENPTHQEFNSLKLFYENELAKWRNYGEQMNKWKEDILVTIARVKSDLLEIEKLRTENAKLKSQTNELDQRLSQLMSREDKRDDVNFLVNLLKIEPK